MRAAAFELPAKIHKRLSQILRLGPAGLVKTAYVLALGPAVYSLTDPARRVASKLHRRRMLGRSLTARLEKLKERAAREVRRRSRRGVRLAFEGDIGSFVQTLEAMLDLAAAGCSVARVVDVDWSANAIVSELLVGRSFSEHAQGGALDEAGLQDLEDVITAIHRAGYVLGDIDEGDVVFCAAATPVITNFAGAIPLAGLSRDMSVYLRDKDRRRINELFGTNLLTASKLRVLLSPKAAITHDKARGLSEVYAPVVVRGDIRWGKIWNTDLGTGRWNFILKDHLPIPHGGSVLDLGSNNGFNPLQILRSGAASALGVEIEPQAIEQAMFLRSAYEWLDNRAYDFRCIHGSQAELPKFDLPRFDMVTALCSLYYLPEREVRDLVGYIATITDLLVLQCNIDRLLDRGGDEEIFRKASVEFAVEMLEHGGFTNRTIIAPSGYSRPLIIARQPRRGA